MAKAGIVYIGTDDGMITLSDPGATGRWRRVGHTLQGQQITAVQALSALEVLIATPAGLHRSTDGGQSWQPIDSDTLSAQALPFALEGNPPAMIGLQPDKNGMQRFVRSEDAGATWQPAAEPTEMQGNVTVVVPAQYHRDVAWAGTAGGDVLRSDDRGRTWVIVTQGLAPVRSLAAVRLA
ncbi:MAG: hypothetical protein HC876_15480 [Chloroflexaceae bacterium]|nr:hypothetical protein [Chloroflexaceae bacterium]